MTHTTAPLTASQVEARLYEMGSVLRRLYVRGCWPAGYRSIMPEPIRTKEEKFAALVEQFDIARRELREINAELEDSNGTLRTVGPTQERVANLAYGVERPAPPMPTPEEITRMDEAMTWVGCLVHPMGKVMFGRRRVFWLKSAGMRTGKIADRLGVNRETVRRWWEDACEQIAYHLSEECCTSRQDMAVIVVSSRQSVSG